MRGETVVKKLSIVFCALITVLLGCSNSNEYEPAPLHPLLSAAADKYSLLVVGGKEIADQNWKQWQEKNEIKNVKSIRWEESLEHTNEQYKFLELDKSPAFVVFDTKDIVFKTYSEKELMEFLKTNNPN